MSLIDIGLPTIDRPFGVRLFPIWDAAFKAVSGTPADEFEFVPGKTPFSTTPETVTTIAAYYAILYFGKQYMNDRKPYKLNALFQLHNVLLTFISGSLLLLFSELLIPELYRNGLFHGICSTQMWTNKMVSLYYANYLIKYVELLDTVFLVLKKKPLTFLHTYHHGATAFLCFAQLLGATSVSWVPITINLLVHVVMYWYYFLSARGIRVWWKEWITRLQISQFVIDIFFIYFASYTFFVGTYFKDVSWLPTMGSCSGTEFAATTGVGIITSYLFLFIGFYISTYKKGSKKPVAKKTQ